MKKLIIFFVVLFQIISIFAQQKYTSADGAYGYEFSDDFSTMQSRQIDLDGAIEKSDNTNTYYSPIFIHKGYFNMPL